MSHIYTFCPSSEALLKKCLAAAPPPDVNNKWMLAFRPKNVSQSQHNLSPDEENVVYSCDVEMKSDIGNCDDLVELIETDMITRWTYIIEECLKNHNSYVLLAEHLTAPSIEKFCKHVLDTNPNHVFLENFCKYFLPKCIKRGYNRLYLDIIVEIHKQNVKLCKILLEVLLQDVDIPSSMLNDYITLLDEKEQKWFLKNVIHIKLSSEHFIHHLPTIINAYKLSNKTEEIQHYIFYLLIQHNLECRVNKNYGKLFLAYLQTERDKNSTLNIKCLKELLENHKTPFSKACDRILSDME